MSRIQLALDVDDIAVATTFYSRLLGVEPAKTRPGYANFVVSEPPLKLVLLENPGRGGSLNHLGIEVDSVEEVDAQQRRLAEVGMATLDERDSTCCYARQDKFWVEGTPSGERWEVYTVLADSATFAGEATPRSTESCCGGTAAADITSLADRTASADITAGGSGACDCGCGRQARPAGRW